MKTATKSPTTKRLTSTTKIDGQSQFTQEWALIQEQLLVQKAQINQSIREYPLPITACDDQFNYLLEKRSTVTQEIGQLNRLVEIDGGEKELRLALDEFVGSSQFLKNGVSSH